MKTYALFTSSYFAESSIAIITNLDYGEVYKIVSERIRKIVIHRPWHLIENTTGGAKILFVPELDKTYPIDEFELAKRHLHEFYNPITEIEIT